MKTLRYRKKCLDWNQVLLLSDRTRSKRKNLSIIFMSFIVADSVPSPQNRPEGHILLADSVRGKHFSLANLVLHRRICRPLSPPPPPPLPYTAKKRVESILDFQLICHLHSGTKCLHTWYINNMYQNVSGKSIENQELILRVFLLC